MISLEANEKTLRRRTWHSSLVPLNTTPDETYFRKVGCGKEFLELNALMVGRLSAAAKRDRAGLKSVTMRV